MNDQPVLHTPGERLAALRMAAGRSLDDVAEATKIPLPMLQALELDEYHKISGELYVKSFLRAYAAEVGLEIEEVLNLYANFSGGGSDVPGGNGSAVWQEEEVQIQRLGVPWATIGIIAVGVLLVGLVVFFLLRGGGDGSEPEPARLPQEGGVPANDDQGKDAKTDTVALQVQGSPVVASEIIEEKPIPAKPAAVKPQAKAVASQDPPQDNLPQAPAGLPGALRIDGQSWPVVLRLVCASAQGVSLKKDGDRRYGKVDWPTALRALDDASIRSGTAYNVREGLAVYWGAEDHFSLKVENPAELRATINGAYRDLSGLGPDEEIILNDPAVINSNLPSARSADRP